MLSWRAACYEERRWSVGTGYVHFTYIYYYFAVPAASPAPTHPSIKDSTTVGQAPKMPAPLLWRRPTAASFMDGCVGAGEAADAAKHA